MRLKILEWLANSDFENFQKVIQSEIKLFKTFLKNKEKKLKNDMINDISQIKPSSYLT